METDALVAADLNHLVYLPRGDAALTRRAKKGVLLLRPLKCHTPLDVLCRFLWKSGPGIPRILAVP
jgi:hypothetical protein